MTDNTEQSSTAFGGARILVVDDDEVARKNLSRIVSREGHHVCLARDGHEALSRFSRGAFDLVITDLVMEDMSGLALLSRVKELDHDCEVIVLTGHGSISTAIEAIRAGAYHYMEKPFRPEEVKHLIERALEKRGLRLRVMELEAACRGAEPVYIGESRAAREVVRVIGQVARTDCNVLITGESGTGKELAASLIHHHSRRRGANFLAINCGAFTEELLANELFGHEKGAYTGAVSQRSGLLEAASGGTLLLDEIGDMPHGMQVKLLRAIEEREIIRVGGTQPLPIDIRVVAATNQDLKKAVSAGTFRQDLFFRLNVISIMIPPLRERKEDIPLLANFFLNRAAKKTGREARSISDEAMRVLMGYDFPGNVRELENIVERAVAMSRENEIMVRDLPPDLSEIDVFSFHHSGADLKTLKEVQQDYIDWVLDRVGRNKTRAADILGIDRASLWRHLKKREIED